MGASPPHASWREKIEAWHVAPTPTSPHQLAMCRGRRLMHVAAGPRARTSCLPDLASSPGKVRLLDVTSLTSSYKVACSRSVPPQFANRVCVKWERLVQLVWISEYIRLQHWISISPAFLFLHRFVQVALLRWRHQS